MDLLARKLLLCLLVVGTTSIKVEDNTNGYSRIYVASPGIRKYRYGISHDREGRDYTIDFNPFIPNVDFDENSLQSRNSLQEPHNYDQLPVTFDVPSYLEQERSSKNIQAVHAAYGKGPDGMADIDLGIMGYGDFMDGPESDHDVYPKSAPVSIAALDPTFPKPPPAPPVRNFKQFKFQHLNKPPTSPPKKFNFQKPSYRPGFGQKITQVPKGQYVFKPVKQMVTVSTAKPLFVPVLQDSHLKGLGDKAYSKVFMAQGHATDVVKLYPKPPNFSRRDFSKALFVPVVYVPGSSQNPMSHTNGRPMEHFTFKSS